MIWAFLTVAGIGFGIGLRYRAPMLAGLAALVVALTALVSLSFGWTFTRFLIVCFSLLGVSQVSYFLGLCVMWTLQKRRV